MASFTITVHANKKQPAEKKPGPVWSGIQPPLLTDPKAPYGFTASGNVRRAPTKHQQELIGLMTGVRIHAAAPLALTAGSAAIAKTATAKMAIAPQSGFAVLEDMDEDMDVEMRDAEGRPSRA